MQKDDHVEGVEAERERNETPAERLDRNWSELLQEMRVTQTGIQILSGFLLTLPFQARFEDLDSTLLWVYLLAVLFSTLSTALLVAPVMAHRLLFRRHVKDTLVELADTLAKVGLGCLAFSVALVMALILGFLLGTTVGLVGGVVTLIGFAALWLLAPLDVLRRTRKSSRYV